MKNNTVGLIILLCSLVGQISAQQLNTPKEFKDIMRLSPIQYFENTASFNASYEVLNSPPFTAQVSAVAGSKNIKKALKKGDRFYKKRRWSKALHCYEKALAIDKNNVWLLRRIGHVLLKQKSYDKALEHLEKVLSVDSKDFEALMYKAECESGLGHSGKATRTIAIAHLYNRNSPVITQKLIEIAALDGLVYDNSWQFGFNYSIVESGKDSIDIKTPNPIWNAYANCKAVWEFDKSYKQAKANDFPKNIDFVQEKECLLNFLIAYEANDIEHRNRVKPLAPKLIQAVETRMINAFIIYEVWAVQNPKSTHELTNAEIDEIMMYLFTIRSTLK